MNEREEGLEETLAKKIDVNKAKRPPSVLWLKQLKEVIKQDKAKEILGELKKGVDAEFKQPISNHLWKRTLKPLNKS